MSAALLYGAYGLTCRSDLSLPELRRVSSPPDVDIQIGPVAHRPASASAESMAVDVSASATWLFHASAGGFCVADGRSITIEPAAGIAPARLRRFVLGPALGTLLRQRERLTLHGSAVASDAAAVVFLGECGAGKSTTAAGFHARGWRLLADDIVAIDSMRSVAATFPGYPRVKLDPCAASLTKMTGPAEDVVDGKGSFCTDREFALQPLPVAHAFVLGGEKAGPVHRLRPPQALVELLRHSYGARTLQAIARDAHFRQCAAFASKVPVSRLPRTAAASFAAFLDLVEEHVARHA